MKLRTVFNNLLRPWLRKHPTLAKTIKSVDAHVDMARHSLGSLLPVIIQPDPREIDIALTAHCNLRCKGCRYGRDFMPGAQLPWEMVRGVLDDAKEFGISNIRLYGGEPLLHKDLVRIVEYGSDLGLKLWLTTNGILLRKRIDDLYQAGLRTIDIGFYGTDDAYNAYVQRSNRFECLEAGVAYARQRYGTTINLYLAWVLMRPTCTVASLQKTWEFAEKYNTPISVNLIHYSLPYFTEGVDRELQFRPEDRPAIEEVVAHLIRLKQARPQLIAPSVTVLRSVPDWLIKGPDMAVPCDKYRLIWVGADGTVQLCYVTFKLGNLHESRLREMLFTPAHHQAAKDAFALRCPRCHCGYPARTEMHVPSRWKYSHDASPSHASEPGRLVWTESRNPSSS